MYVEHPTLRKATGDDGVVIKQRVPVAGSLNATKGYRTNVAAKGLDGKNHCR